MRGTLVANVATPVAIAALANGALAAFGLLRPESERWPAFAPPGHTIGAIWVVLFVAMGVARWSLLRSREATANSSVRVLDVLIVMCLAYPFYTHVIGGHAIELVGNVATFALAVWLALRVRRDRAATMLVATVALWIAFATVLVAELVRLNGWS